MLEVSDLTSIFEEFTDNTGIVITESAQLLIVQLINSVEVDPHETWRIQSDRLEAYERIWPEVLPNILRRIALDHQLARQITSTDIVYWVGNNLQSMDFLLSFRLCFPGPDELPRGTLMAFPWNLNRRR